MTQTRELVSRVSAAVHKYLTLEDAASVCGECEPEPVLDIITSREFSYKKPTTETRDYLISRFRSRIREQQPIRVNILVGARKNPNAIFFDTDNCADFSETFALYQLARLHQNVKRVYSPSLDIKIFCDDERAITVNGYKRESTEAYITSLRTLVINLGLSHIVKGVFSFKELYRNYSVTDHLAMARTAVTNWERNPQSAEAIRFMEKSCRRNMPNSDHLKTAEVKEAAHWYRVYFEAERIAGIYGIDDLWATYRNASGLLWIYSLGKGIITQPWQGKGCLVLKDEKAIPFVLSQGRKLSFETVFIYDPREVNPNIPEYLGKIKVVKEV